MRKISVSKGDGTSGVSDRMEIRPIPGHPKYGASADGRIWSRCRGPWHVLSTSLDTKGQPKVNITGGKTFKVHTLVALAFLGPRPPKHDVDHKDGKKENCAASNLEYCTRSRNMIRALKAGRIPSPPAWVRDRVSRPKSSRKAMLVDLRTSAAMKLGIRQVPDRPNYGVTSNGFVWSFARGRVWKKLVPTPDTRGLPKVKLGHRQSVSVHTLVAAAFIGPRPDGMTITHKDGRRWNTAASNLQYVAKSPDNLLVWATGAQSSGWSKRRSRLKAMGYDKWGPSGSYPTPDLAIGTE